MKVPSFSLPRVPVVLLSLVSLTGWSAGAPAAATEATPPAAEASDGWVGRMVSAPKKLVFWRKDYAEAAPEAAAPVPVAATPQPKSSSKKAAVPTRKPAARATAPVAPPVPAPEAEPKTGFWSKLNPFDNKPADPPLEAAAPAKPATAAPPAAASPKKKGAKTPAPVVEAPPAPEPKKPGFLARIWPGKSEAQDEAATPVEPAPSLSKAEQRRLERLQARAEAATGGAEKTRKGNKLEGPQPVPEPLEKKSWWAKLKSLGPQSEEEPETVTPSATPLRMVRGAAPIPPSGKPEADRFVINKDKTPFYLYGPNQATPPDDHLRTGMLVTLKSKNWGWAEVTLPDGRSGVMARDALRQATAYDLAPLHPAVVAAKPKHRPITPSFVLPPAALPELPSLLPDTPVVPGNEGSAEELSNALLPPYVE